MGYIYFIDFSWELKVNIRASIKFEYALQIHSKMIFSIKFHFFSQNSNARSLIKKGHELF